MASDGQRTRCQERLELLSRSTLDCESLQREAIGELRRVIGFDRWCWPLADPETLLPGSGVADHDYGPGLPRALELEFSGVDYAAKDVLARRTTLAGSLAVETSGDLARSPRWDEVKSTSKAAGASISAICATALPGAVFMKSWWAAPRR